MEKTEIVKITDLAPSLGLSSRSVRYYEEVGLIKSVRLPHEKYRFFDASNVERLKQIVVLRKMMIPIKDILRIYESEDMGAVVEVFVRRLREIDEETDALLKLRRITDEFLQTMRKNGVKKISALPLLYEALESENGDFQNDESPESPFDELAEISGKLTKPVDIAILSLPPMRVLSSFLKAEPDNSDADGFHRWIQARGMNPGAPGNHERFEFQRDSQDVAILRIDGGFENAGPYLDFAFEGGLFASCAVYLDEDLGERFRALVSAFDGNKFYEIDFAHGGGLRREAMLENLISPDEKRSLVSIFVPVKKRLADPSLYERPVEIAPETITIKEIEAQNPVLWEKDVPLDKLTQTHPRNSYFHINEDGEAEFISRILRAVLNTHVSVKLPFRIDMEFRPSGEGRTGIIFYPGEDIEYHFGNDARNRRFGVNMSNDNEKMRKAIRFSQPIFWDDFHFPERGAIKKDEINRLTWIVGEKHLAVIINGEIRYCGVNFPYMALDLSREDVCPIVIGTQGNEKIYFRSIRVSQLECTPKNKIKKEELIMITKQSNNIIPIIHRLVTDEYGENYWFNGCAKYVMECLGEPGYDYWFFAGLTGDIFTQHYSFTNLSSDSASGYLAEDDPAKFYEDTFHKCGYAATFVSGEDVLKNTEMYLQTLIAYIDKGIPVIRCGSSTGVFVGYENYGKILLYITGNTSEPERIELDSVFEPKPFHGYEYKSGWIFVGDKKDALPLAEVYRNAIKDIIPMQNIKTDNYCLGSEAFRAWAQDIENGKFDRMAAEEFDTWCDHTNYICVLATNGSCCHEFLKRAQSLNPDMTFLDEISKLYRKTANIGSKDGGNDLEALGGGFNVTLAALQDKEKRGKIAARIRDCADVIDEILRILRENLK